MKAEGDALAPLPERQRPLVGTLVLDFSQFMAGPVAAMRLGDLGARVVKVERPRTGDLGRQLRIGGLQAQGDSLSFHALNRGKASLVADLKRSDDLGLVRRLVCRADVLIQNFRPGVMERLGLGYDTVAELNPRCVYASVTGYGAGGPWKDRPGQDLLVQALSGLAWLNGSDDDPPVPVGVSVADLLASCHLTEGILACLLRRERTGKGGLVETSLLEAMVDLQLEVLTAYLYNHSLSFSRGNTHRASPFIPAPYGVYPTSDGYLAVAMTSVPDLGRLVGVDLDCYQDSDTWWSQREVITEKLAAGLRGEPTAHWLGILERADVWCAPVLTVAELAEHEAFKSFDLVQTVRTNGGLELRTPRSPIRIDGRGLQRSEGAPRLGEHSQAIRAELETTSADVKLEGLCE